jgi:hypothetical protein
MEADGVIFDGYLDNPGCQYLGIEIVVLAWHRGRVLSLPGLASLLHRGGRLVRRRHLRHHGSHVSAIRRRLLSTRLAHGLVPHRQRDRTWLTCISSWASSSVSPSP